MRSGELGADLGPDRPHPTAGATLVTARPPLAAFNLVLDTGELEIASRDRGRSCASPGAGRPGVRAMAVDLDGRAQVSTNIHDPVAVPLATVIERVRELAARARRVAGRRGRGRRSRARGGARASCPPTCRWDGFDPDRT